MSTDIVAIEGGLEAAVWDQSGDIDFWKLTGTSPWVEVGKSRYIEVRDEPVGITVTGAVLTGDPNATFIASGAFSGDGTGAFEAFSTGSSGWGYLEPISDSTALIPSGLPSTDNTTPGNSYYEGFVGGDLERADPGTLPFGTNGSEWMVIRTYRWAGSYFAQTQSNVFTAASAAVPPSTSGLSSPQSCPSIPGDGTYRDFGVVGSTTFGSTPRLNQPISVKLTFERDGPYPTCVFTVDPNFPVTIPATTSTGATWITAPAWALTNGTYTASGQITDIGDVLLSTQFPGQFNEGAASFQDPVYWPYYIGASEIGGV